MEVWSPELERLEELLVERGVEAPPVDLVRHALLQVLGGEDRKAGARAVRQVAALAWPELLDDLWPLLESDDEELRSSAVEALAALGEAAFAKARPLVGTATPASVRAAAIRLLSHRPAPEDLRLFRERLRSETDDEARRALWEALASHPWPFPEPAFTDDELRRLLRPGGRRPALPKWVPEERLPELRWSGGEALSRGEVRALLERFVRRREVELDPEVTLLAARLDSASSAAFAGTLLEAHLGGGADARHRWALAAAVHLGGAAVVPALLQGTLALAEARRLRAAAPLVRALALSRSDEALQALDTLAQRARGRREALAEPAREALAAAARRRGVSVAELEDTLVPWLGFSPEGQRALDGLELLPSPRHTLLLRDAETKRRFAKPPKGLSRDALAELRRTGKALAEAGKTQATRLEQAMVNGRRWPAARWRSLFLANPVLLPFAIRLVWRLDGGATFRALADRTLTTDADEELALPDTGWVSLAHPVLLSEAEVEAWRDHLTAHSVEPPFPQLSRAVVTAGEAEREATSYDAAAGTEVNGFAFRARAEKRGWTQLESGYYVRRFEGLEAWLELQGFPGGYSEEVTLGPLRFRREGGRRALRLGEVKPVVYSEAMGDLRAFAAG